MTRQTFIVYGLVLVLALSLVYTRVTTRSLYLQLQGHCSNNAMISMSNGVACCCRKPAMQSLAI